MSQTSTQQKILKFGGNLCLDLLIACAVAALQLSGCGLRQTELESTVVVNSDEIPLDTSQNTLLKNYRVGSCDRLVLEATTLRTGLTSPKGVVLDLRVLDNGEMEYDVVNVGQPNSAVLRKISAISESQMIELQKLLRSRLDWNSSAEYAGDYYCCDVFITKAIKFCEDGQPKIVSISEYDTSLHLTRKERLPTTLVNLIQTIDRINGAKSFSEE